MRSSVTVYLDSFHEAARRIKPELRAHGLEAEVGYWLGAAALKIRKSHWVAPERAEFPRPGIFFSVWVEEKSLKRNRAYYNIHALRLRSLSGYALQSRAFAAAFRAAFSAEAPRWPALTFPRGPQTLIEGWIAVDEHLPEATAKLVTRFIPVAASIDALLAAHKRPTEAAHAPGA